MFELWRTILVFSGACSLVLAIVWLLHAWFRQEWRTAFLGSLVILGTVIWAVTEVLSAPRFISFPMLSAAWSLLWLVGAALCAWTWLARRGARSASLGGHVRRSLKAMPAEQLLIIGFTVLASGTLLAVAAIAAPNTWDSLTYHLSRVMHWEQNHTLRFYPTAIERQLSFGPLAEMAILNLQILAGSDHLANLVQFCAMLGCLAGASLLAARLGGGATVQAFAALATLTLPMGILQATSTQTDYVAALWCTCFVVFANRQTRSERSIVNGIVSGAALGLSLMTKATSVIFLAPFLLLHVLRLFGRLRWLAWRPMLLVIAAATVIVAPHTWRNLSTYRNPLGMTNGLEQAGHLNASFDPSTMLANSLKNAGSQLGTSSTEWNRVVESGVLGLLRAMGINANDPRSTWPGSQYQVFSERHEDSEGNPLHLLLILAAIALLPRRGTRTQVIYLVCLLVGFFLFSLVLRWQPWGSRLLLPLFVLAMPFAATLFANRLSGKLILLPAVLLSLAAIPYLLENPSRPILGGESVFLNDRLHQYFSNVPDDVVAYEGAAHAIRDAGCNNVGLVTRYDGREYLAWITVLQQVPDARLEHILVKNPSRRYADDAFSPCAILVMKGLPGDTLAYRSRAYLKVVETDTLDLFLADMDPD